MHAERLVVKPCWGRTEVLLVDAHEGGGLGGLLNSDTLIAQRRERGLGLCGNETGVRHFEVFLELLLKQGEARVGSPTDFFRAFELSQLHYYVLSIDT